MVSRQLWRTLIITARLFTRYESDYGVCHELSPTLGRKIPQGRLWKLCAFSSKRKSTQKLEGPPPVVHAAALPTQALPWSGDDGLSQPRAVIFARGTRSNRKLRRQTLVLKRRLRHLPRFHTLHRTRNSMTLLGPGKATHSPFSIPCCTPYARITVVRCNGLSQPGAAILP